MSGHSKWATIKRKKGALDAKRGKLFTKLIKEITVATRMGGGGDIDTNARLRKAVNDAKGQSMPADTIKRAIQRGTGEIEGVNYDEIIYEGTGPGGTLFLLEAMTDNRNRTVAEIRKIFERHNGTMGAGGSAQWAFERKGIILIAKEAANEDQLMEIAVGAGADDYSDQGEEWQVLCSVSVLEPVGKALEEAKIPVKSSNPGYVPKSKKLITGREAELCLNLAEALDDHDDAQNVYSDFDVSEEEMARLAGE
jgi:YebC/PmpR family DNA-binding regulatory protein